MKKCYRCGVRGHIAIGCKGTPAHVEQDGRKVVMGAGGRRKMRTDGGRDERKGRIRVTDEGRVIEMEAPEKEGSVNDGFDKVKRELERRRDRVKELEQFKERMGQRAREKEHRERKEREMKRVEEEREEVRRRENELERSWRRWDICVEWKAWREKREQLRRWTRGRQR